jgi:hypothetical protein
MCALVSMATLQYDVIKVWNITTALRDTSMVERRLGQLTLPLGDVRLPGIVLRNWIANIV